MASPDQALVGLLRTTPPFVSLPRGGLIRIASQMRRRHVLAGTVVIKQGAPARALYLLESGRLEVTVEGGDAESPPVNILDAPSWFGEMAVLTRQPRTSTVTALIDSEVWTLPLREFEAARARYPQIGRSVLHSLCERIQHKDQDFLGQSALAIERARLLADLQERNDARWPHPTVRRPCTPNGGGGNGRHRHRGPVPPIRGKPPQRMVREAP